MKSSYLTNVLLLCLIAGLYWYNNQEAAVRKQQQLTMLDQHHIQHITISRPNSTDITLGKLASGWQLVCPFQAQANITRIKLLLSLLNTASYAQLDSSASLQQFGLSSNFVQLTLDDQVFQFGDVESISNHRYVLHNNIIHLTEDKVMPLLNANASSFIENRLFTKESHIQQIRLPFRNDDDSLSPQTMMIENMEGHWRSKSTQYTADQLSKFISSWQHTYALQVVPVNDSMHRDPEPVIIKILFKEQIESREFELQLGNNALFLIDTEAKLRYQFSKVMAKLLLPTNNMTL